MAETEAKADVNDYSGRDNDAFSVVAAARDVGERLALIDAEGTHYSYAELSALVLARVETLTLPAEGRPFVISPKACVSDIVTLLALLHLKVPFVLLHPTLTDVERNELLARLDSIDEPLPVDAQAILFTSGTTGAPKPAVLSRRALMASALSNAENLALGEGDVWLLCMSPARIGGLSILTRSLLARSAVALSPKFTSRGFVDVLAKTKTTVVSVVPTMLAKVLDEVPEWVPSDELRAILLGGSSCPDTLRDRAFEKGLPIMTTYGMTETASNVVTTPYVDRFSRTSGNGHTNAGVSLELRDGDIWVKGPMLMSGYWGVSDTYREDTWFKTGDMGEWDEKGNLRILSRRSDLIVSGGDNVYPVEVENVLTTIPGIKDALVVGLSDPTWGAIVTALLVRDEGVEVSLDALQDAMREKLSPYKRPRRVAWVDDLPVNPAGKPDRREARLSAYTLTPLHWTTKKA